MKSLKVVIEYNCSEGNLCPICVLEALKAYDKNSLKEYKLRDLTVKELKTEK